MEKNTTDITENIAPTISQGAYGAIYGEKFKDHMNNVVLPSPIIETKIIDFNNMNITDLL